MVPFCIFSVIFLSAILIEAIVHNIKDYYANKGKTEEEKARNQADNKNKFSTWDMVRIFLTICNGLLILFCHLGKWM